MYREIHIPGKCPLMTTNQRLQDTHFAAGPDMGATSTGSSAVAGTGMADVEGAAVTATGVGGTAAVNGACPKKVGAVDGVGATSGIAVSSTIAEGAMDVIETGAVDPKVAAGMVDSETSAAVDSTAVPVIDSPAVEAVVAGVALRVDGCMALKSPANVKVVVAEGIGDASGTLPASAAGVGGRAIGVVVGGVGRKRKGGSPCAARRECSAGTVTTRGKREPGCTVPLRLPSNHPSNHASTAIEAVFIFFCCWPGTSRVICPTGPLFLTLEMYS